MKDFGLKSEADESIYSVLVTEQFFDFAPTVVVLRHSSDRRSLYSDVIVPVTRHCMTSTV